MTRIAITIGSYLLVDFVELNIACCRHVFGADVPILVSDDISKNSPEIRELCEKHKVHYATGGPRGHFAGDAMAAVNAICFARWKSAELALKISQRFIFIEPIAAEILSNHFGSPNIWLGVPGRISPHTIQQAASRFFANFSVLSDMVCIRTNSITPDMLKDRYEHRVRNATHDHDKLIESLWSNLLDTHFSGHTVFMNEFSHPQRPPIYLRKAQSQPADYERVAMERGVKINPVLVEWSRMEPSYRPRPVFL